MNSLTKNESEKIYKHMIGMSEVAIFTTSLKEKLEIN